jgi:hypothetical protein
MQQPSPLLNLILQQNLSGLPDKDFLQQVTSVYPYFTPAQFYLLQQLPQDDIAYNKQAAKTAVLFNNPYWLHYQLQQKTVVNPTEEITAAITTAESTADEMPSEIEDVSPQQKPAAIKENSAITAMENPTPEQIMLSENKEHGEEPIMEEEIAPMKITLQMPQIKSSGTGALTFEPMHLVDYFASQGIKLSEEVQTADKLGKQLKSFTEWLKTMKKIHVPAEDTVATHSDIIIQTMAEKSNTENEVLTEAMADVLAQQGKAGKAIELYKKLSLLNPSKIAYFAAKIEQLKGV